jgi:tetraacyldisaccharide 4'-kinase
MRAPRFYFRPPGLASFLLLPFAMLYGAVAGWRMRRPGARAGVPVICIGNPTLGGAGKTPTAIAVARLLAAMGEKPAFVSRGYGGSDAGPVQVDPGAHDAARVGDEPLLLARHFPTFVARDRLAGGRLAAASGASVLVLDDGFQNPLLAKDCSLLVIDGAVGVGNGDVFPAGPLRAPLSAQLALAQGVVRVGAGEASRAVESQAVTTGLPVFSARLTPDSTAATALKGAKVLAFAGIGRPEKFFETLRATGANIVETRSFDDHHRFSANDAQRLLAAAKARSLLLVTTEKDMARMQGDPALAELAAQATSLPVQLSFEDLEGVRRLLERTLRWARTQALARPA